MVVDHQQEIEFLLQEWELLEAGKGGLCVSEVNGQIKGLPITEVLGHKRETDFSIYEDAIKLR